MRLRAAALLFLSPGVAHAQSAQNASNAAPEKQKEGDEIVITGTRTPEKSQRATVKVDVVTREEAERRGATNVAEALQSQAGVQVNPAAYGFLGGVAAIQIQGFDRDRILILEDGERVVGDTGGAVDLANIPISDLARIEIVTGPTSSLYGSSAIGGVVNLITAPPAFEGPSGRARAELRTGPGTILSASGAYRKRKFWAGLDTSYSYQEKILSHPPALDTQIPSAERGMIGMRGGFPLSENVDVRIRARWFHDHAQGLTHKDLPGLPTTFYDLPEETNRWTLHAIVNARIDRHATLRITLGRQWYENETKTDLQNSPVDEIHDRHQRMQSAEATVTVADGPRTWVTGTRFEAESFRQEFTQIAATPTGLVTTSNPEQQPLMIANGAAYEQLGWKIGPLTLMPGVRLEGNTKYGGQLAPRFAAALNIGKTIIVRGSVGHGYRAPSGKELGFIFDHSFYGYRVLGNPNLRPESSWGGNGDVTYTPMKQLQLRLGAFGNAISDLIDIDLANGQSNGSVTTYSYKNFASATTIGVEARATIRPNESFRAEVGYDYLFTRTDDPDVGPVPLVGRPDHTISAAITWKLPWKLELYGRWRTTSDAYLSTDPKTLVVSHSPGFTSADLRLARTLWPRSQAYVGVLNSFNEHLDPNRIGDLRPPLGRVVYVGLRAEAPWEE
jgi:outer membrane receptor for ferrienterochelin and colicins